MTQPEASNNASANTFTSGTSTGIPATLFTQEQVNHFNAEAKRGAVNSYFKELGFDKPPTGEELNAAIEAATEYQRLKDGEKTEVQRLTGEIGTLKTEAEKVPGLEAAKRRAELAGDAGLKSRYHRYVEGTTDEEITASIQEVLADIRGGGSGEGQQPQPEQQPAKKGTGRLEPAPQQGMASGTPPKPSMQAGRDAYKAKTGT